MMSKDWSITELKAADQGGACRIPRGRLMMDLSETAGYLGCTRDEAVFLVLSGKLESVVMGGHHRVRCSSIHEYAETRDVQDARSAHHPSRTLRVVPPATPAPAQPVLAACGA